MSKNAKLNAREQRRRQKAKVKAQKAAEYAARAASGDNSKVRGGRRASKRPPVLAKHAVLNCGNVGCLRCHPELAGLRAARWRKVRLLIICKDYVRSITVELSQTIWKFSQKVSAPRE